MKDFVYIHIAKNAGTSLVRSLCGSQTIGHVTAKYEMARDPKKWDEAFTFTFVRNPWDRIVSAYEFAKMEKSYWHNNKSQKKQAHHPDYEMAKSKSFEEFVCDFYCNRDMCKHVSFRPQCDFFCDTSGRSLVDFVGRYENLDRDFAYVCGALGKPNITLCRINTSSKEFDDYRYYYSSEDVINMVADIYKDDLKVTYYEFE